MKKSVIIVGAGISGLSAGYYAQLNGLKTTIFEMHTIPGGLCAAWKRKGYTFDISMHLLTGSKSGPYHQMWKELGIADSFKFHYHDQASLIEGNGQKLIFSTNPKEVREQMLSISPEDARLIKEFVDLIFAGDMMGSASLKPAELITFPEKIWTFLTVLPLMGKIIKYRNQTVQEFALRFKNQFLREAVRMFVDAPGWPMPQFPMIVLTGFMNSAVMSAGVPIGGSQQVVFKIAERFTNLGGEIKFRSRVTDLVIENNMVKGIRLEDGSAHYADQIIWAGDGHTLIYEILKGKYLSDRIKEMYNSWIPVCPMVHVMMGVNMDFSGEPHSIIFKPGKTIAIAGYGSDYIGMLHHCFDKTMSPEGKSVVEVWFETEFTYWEKVYEDREKYNEEKQRIADYVIRELDNRYPGFASQIEVTDVATPATYKRYTGNWKGSPDGWYVTQSNIMAMEPVRTLPGLEGLFMAGQWTAPFTGTVIAAVSGRQVIQILSRKSGKKFLV